MIRKVLYILNDNQKFRLLILIILMFIAMLLEAISLGAILPLLTFFIDPVSITKIFLDYKFLNFLITYNQNEVLISLLFLLVFIFIFKFLFLLFVAYFQANYLYELTTSVSRKMFNYYLNNNYLFHVKTNSSILLRNVTSEVNLFSGVVASLMNLFLEIFTIIGILVLLLYVETYGTIFAMIITLSSILFYYYFSNKKLLDIGNKRLTEEATQIKYLIQSFSGIKDIKISNKEEFFFNKFKISNKLIAYYVKIKQIILSIPRLLMEFVLMISVIIFIIIMLNNKSFYEIVPSLGLVAASSIRIMPSVSKILNNLSILRYSHASLKTIFEEYEFISQSDRLKNIKFKEIIFSKKIELKDISFGFNQNTELLKDFNITINKGEKIGIIGKSGSGKSTFVDLLLGLIKPDNGKIFCDNLEVVFNNNNWRNLFGYVPQKIYLLDDTIKNNIAFGENEEEIDELSLNKATNLSQLDDFISTLPHGINTNVGERGSKISGGQLQRIGIARALYKNPEIIIFDEATSSLDTKTENNLLKTINLIKGNKTLIIISHNFDTLKDCEKIYKIQKGKIIQAKI